MAKQKDFRTESGNRSKAPVDVHFPPCCVRTYRVSGVVLDGVLDLTVGAVVDVHGAVVPPEAGEDSGSHGCQLGTRTRTHTQTGQSERG